MKTKTSSQVFHLPDSGKLVVILYREALGLRELLIPLPSKMSLPDNVPHRPSELHGWRKSPRAVPRNPGTEAPLQTK
jgi:hypothetical protein